MASGAISALIIQAQSRRHCAVVCKKNRATSTCPGPAQPDLDLRNTRFRDAIADLAAPIHGVAKDDLEGEDVRQHRRTRRVAGAAITTLAMLLILSLAAGGFALTQRNDARNQATAVEARGLSGLAGEKQPRIPTSRCSWRLRRSVSTTRSRLGAVLLRRWPRTPASLGSAMSSVTMSPRPYRRQMGGSWRADIGTAPSVSGIRVTMRLQATVRQAHRGPVAALSFSADSSALVSGSLDGTVRAWRSRSGAAASDVLQGDADGVIGLAFRPDGRQFVATGRNGTVRRWAYPEAVPLGTTPVVAGFTYQPAFSPNGRSIVVGASDDTVRFIDADTGTLTDVRDRRHASVRADRFLRWQPPCDGR